MAANLISTSNTPGRGQLMELIKNLRQNIVEPKTENCFISKENNSNIHNSIPTCNAIFGTNVPAVSGETLDCPKIKAEPSDEKEFDQPADKKIKLEDSSEENEQNNQELGADPNSTSYHITKNGLNQWILHHHDYQYCMQRRGSNLWHCIHVSQCPALCVIQKSSLSIMTQHNHLPQPNGYVYREVAKDHLKPTATLNNDSIIKEILAGLSLNLNNVEAKTKAGSMNHESPNQMRNEEHIVTTFTNEGDPQPQPRSISTIGETRLNNNQTIESFSQAASPDNLNPSMELAIKNDRSLMQLWNTLVQDSHLEANQNIQDLSVTNGLDESELTAEQKSDDNLFDNDFFTQLMTNFTSSPLAPQLTSSTSSKLESSVEELYLRQHGNPTANRNSTDGLHTIDSNFRYFLTLKGNKLLIHDNFIYRIRQEGSKRWRCTEKSCPGKAMLTEELIYVTEGHNHPPDLDKLEKKSCLNDLVCAAFKCEDMSQVDQLYSDFTSALPAISVSFLPTLASLRQLYQQIKKCIEEGIPNTDMDGSQYDNVTNMASLIKNYRSMASKEFLNTHPLNTNENQLVSTNNSLQEKVDGGSLLNDSRTVKNKKSLPRKIAIKRDADFTLKDMIQTEAPNYEIDNSFKTYLMYASQNNSPVATSLPVNPLTIRIKRAPTKIAPAPSEHDESLEQTKSQHDLLKTKLNKAQLNNDQPLSASPLPNAEDYHPVKCRFIKNLQGHSQIVHCDFNYRLRGEGVNRWRCVEAGCRGKCSVFDGNSIIVTCEHDHPPYPEKVKKKEILGNILSRACEFRELNAEEIIREATRDLKHEALICLPNALVIKQMIERARNSDFGSNDLFKRVSCKTPAWHVGVKSSASYKTPKSLVRQRPPNIPNSSVENKECDSSELPYTFLMSINGSKQIVYQGYNYRMRVPSKNRWRCVEAGCLGACFAEGNLIQITQEHNHKPKEEKIARKKVLGDLVYRAVVTQPELPAEALIDQVMAELDGHIRAQLPSYTSLKQLVARSRSTSSTLNGDIPHDQESLYGNESSNNAKLSKGVKHSLKSTTVIHEGVNETLQYFISRKGQCHIIFKGYVYRWPRLNKNTWRCKSKVCGGKCVMQENRIKIVAAHNHPPIIDQENFNFIDEADLNTTGSFLSPSESQATTSNQSPSGASNHLMFQDDHPTNVSIRATNGDNNAKSENMPEAASYKYLYQLGYVLALEYDFTTHSHYNLQSRKRNLLVNAQLERLRLYNESLHIKIQYKCPRCPFSTESNLIMDDHQRKPHRKISLTRGSNSQSILECPYCEFVSQWAPLMCEHLKVQHNLTSSTMPPIEPVPREYMCPRCPYEVDIEKNWAQHIEKCLNRKNISADIQSPNENVSSYFPLLKHLKSPVDYTSGCSYSLSEMVPKYQEAQSVHNSSKITPVTFPNQSDRIELVQIGTAFEDASVTPKSLDEEHKNAKKVDKYNISLDGVQLIARLTDQKPQNASQDSLNLSSLTQKESSGIENSQNNSAINSKGLASTHFLLTTHRDRLKKGLKRIMNRHEKGEPLEDLESLNNIDYYLEYLIPQTIYDILKDAIKED